MLHPDVEEAIDQIDAAVFSGDTFQDLSSAEILSEAMVRWSLEIQNILRSIREKAQASG